jgi:hypothetical protein
MTAITTRYCPPAPLPFRFFDDCDCRACISEKHLTREAAVAEAPRSHDVGATVE